ncbi:MAG: T9SS type A sorting domain-containing protein [candidate division Zixibacteria bacterium]|nr:T9SS type A sorting domain-containing protein [candidate division Zixibacteria bacterium]
MRNVIVLTLIGLLALSSILTAQEITHQEFRRTELDMKYRFSKAQLERQQSGMSLDQTDYDIKYYRLELDVTDIAGQTISGNVTAVAEAVTDGVTEIEYDFKDAMDVDSVYAGGQQASFTHNLDQIAIILDRTYDEGDLITTVVFYNGHPEDDERSFWWSQHDGQPMISTHSEPEGAREWWPCKDMPHDKADSADIIVTVPDNLVATSNGSLVSDTNNGDGTRTFHWHSSYPIVNYLISLCISNYESFTDWYVSDQGDSMPIVNYVFPEHFDDAVEDLNITADAITMFAEMFGEYPFLNDKYGHSIFPWGGAMEHQCNTSYGEDLITGTHYYDWILVHELAHMWFGDLITCDIWPEIWMNEGFASYLEALYMENLYGFQSYVNYMTGPNNVYFPSGPIYDPNPLFDGNSVYNKGSWVLHMLRGVMGDMPFFAGMYAYANHPDYMHGTITTHQFKEVMEEFYEDDLDWFFDQWVWGQNRPFYTYSWMAQDIGDGRNELYLHLTQSQSNPAPEVFKMPVRIYPRIGGEDVEITFFNDQREYDYRFLVNSLPTSLQFDKDSWILKFAALESYGVHIITNTLPDGEYNQVYHTQLEVRGGVEPYFFTLVDGTLPYGLILDVNTGEIYGIANFIDEFTFTVRVTDSATPTPHTSDKVLSIVVEEVVAIDDEAIIPSEFILLNNYPNPFNNSTVISFQLTQPGEVNLDIYNLLGQQVAGLHSGYLNSGQHDFLWQADSAPSGVYFYKLTTGDNTEVQKMTLLK